MQANNNLNNKYDKIFKYIDPIVMITGLTALGLNMLGFIKMDTYHKSSTLLITSLACVGSIIGWKKGDFK